MPRTTIDLDASVLRQLRRRGRREKKSLGRVASELLARSLAEPEDASAAAPFTWVARNLGTPRVDLEDTEALRQLLDETNQTLPSE